MNDKPCAKKPRTIYTPQQICYLEEQFTKEEFPNKGKRKVIADYLNISEHHVQVGPTLVTIKFSQMLCMRLI